MRLSRLLICSSFFFTVSFSTGFGQDIITGEVCDSVYLLNDKSQFYSIYVPKGYDSTKKWPVIFLFDPRGYALQSVKMYHQSAEELGYIMVCTYNSRNGPIEKSFEAFELLYEEISNIYSIDKDRLITSGFSGGSRLSLALAKKIKINSVIACGAGEPGMKNLGAFKNDRYNYVSLVGNEDFNFQEVRQLNDKMNTFSINNYRIVFDGAHQWPPIKYYHEALLWLKTQNEGTYKKEFVDQITKRIKKKIENNELVESKRLLDFLETNYEDIPQQISLSFQEKEKQLKEQVKSWDRVVKHETKLIKRLNEDYIELDKKLQLGFSPSPDSIDVGKWESHIKRFSKLQEQEDSLKIKLGNRMRSFVAAGMAERSFYYTEINSLDVAIILNRIWISADLSLWGYWMISKLYARLGESEEAVKHLKYLLDNSPNLKIKRILSEPSFSDLSKTEEFNKLIANYD